MMKDKNQIINQQKEFISELKQKTLDFISKIDKTEIETILLSGSVARGDYFPGKYGGMTDLIIMRKPGSMISPEELLGENQDPGIPYHCVCSEGNWFEILFSMMSIGKNSSLSVTLNPITEYTDFLKSLLFRVKR